MKQLLIISAVALLSSPVHAYRVNGTHDGTGTAPVGLIVGLTVGLFVFFGEDQSLPCKETLTINLPFSPYHRLVRLDTTEKGSKAGTCKGSRYRTPAYTRRGTSVVETACWSCSSSRIRKGSTKDLQWTAPGHERIPPLASLVI